MSFRLRLALGGVAVAAIVLALFVTGVDALIGAAAGDDRDKRLARLADDSLDSLRQAPRGNLTVGIAPTALPLADLRGPFVAVFDGSGRLLSATARPERALEQLLAASGGSSAAPGLLSVTVAGERIRLDLRRWRRDDLGLRGTLVAGEPARLTERERAGGRVFLVVAGVIALLVAALATWFVSGRAMRPLRQLAATAAEIGETGDLGRRLPARRRQDVLGTLTTSFNGMLDRLAESRRRTEDALEQQQRFVADASHELRTPLTTIRSNAGLLLERADVTDADRRDALADIAAEGERMGRLVDGLLVLARGDAGAVVLAADTIDLAGVVEQAVAAAQRGGLRVQSELASAEVTGDREALLSVLRILFDNAARHGGGQGVAVALAATGQEALVTVEDTGPGIPEESVSRVFDRFYEADPARRGEGAGLGLAIARALVEAHRGTITAANRPGERGAVFTIALPLAPSS